MCIWIFSWPNKSEGFFVSLVYVECIKEIEFVNLDKLQNIMATVFLFVRQKIICYI